MAHTIRNLTSVIFLFELTRWWQYDVEARQYDGDSAMVQLGSKILYFGSMMERLRQYDGMAKLTTMIPSCIK